MNRIFLMGGLAAAALLGFATQANAEEGWYVAARAGQAFHTEANGIRLGDDMAFGGFLGLKAGPWRFEAGAQRISADTNIGYTQANIDAIDYQATLYLDIDLSQSVTAYGGVGLDRIQAEAAILNYSASNESNGWHATAGGAVRVSEHGRLEAQVSRIQADGFSFGGNDVNATAYVGTIGYRHSF